MTHIIIAPVNISCDVCSATYETEAIVYDEEKKADTELMLEKADNLLNEAMSIPEWKFWRWGLQTKKLQHANIIYRCLAQDRPAQYHYTVCRVCNHRNYFTRHDTV